MREHNVTLMSTTVETAPRPVPALDPPALSDVLGVRRPAERRPRDARDIYLQRVTLAVDAVALIVALLGVQLGVGLLGSGPHKFQHGAAMLLVALASWIAVARAHDHYRLASRRANHDVAEDIGAVLWTSVFWSWGVLLAAWVIGLPTPPVPKLAAFSLATLLSVTTLRALARSWSRRRTWYRQSAVVVATPDEAAGVIPKLLRHPEYGIDLVATIEVPGEDGADPVERWESAPWLPIIRGEVDLLEITHALDVDRVIFGPSLHRLPDYHEVICELKARHLHVDILPSWFEVVGAQASLHELEGMALIALPGSRLTPGALFIKRALDVVLAAGALLVLSPLLAASALAIKLDSDGPVLFRQPRVGRGNRRFELFKFRSMRADAELVKHDVAHLNDHGGGTATGMFKIREDPRITRVGRVLRRHSIDELPQLINVLRGDMSLVGPRPLIENEDRQVEGRHRRRIMLTPGLTGLWQVNGRSDIPFQGMIDLDYVYVTNWSLGGDIKILLRTLSAVTRGRGAY